MKVDVIVRVKMNAIVVLVFFVFFQGNLGCDNGWISYNEHCYHISHDSESWIGSEGVCLHFGAYLAEINDHYEDMFLQNWSNTLNKFFWIGGADLDNEGDWMWVNSKIHFNKAYTRWLTGEPNNKGGSENCLILSPHWDWNDDLCSKLMNFICEKYGP